VTGLHAGLQIPEFVLEHVESPVFKSQAEVFHMVQVLLHFGRPGRVGPAAELSFKISSKTTPNLFSLLGNFIRRRSISAWAASS
jgi:hypothetical protein